LQRVNQLLVRTHDLGRNASLESFSKKANVFKKSRRSCVLAAQNPAYLRLACSNMGSDLGLRDAMQLADATGVFSSGLELK